MLCAARVLTMTLVPQAVRVPRPSNSMLNLRRSVAQKLQIRPRSTAAPPSAFPAPPRATSPPPRERTSLGSDPSRTVGVGLRALPLSPTMHNRETMMLEAGRIEDDESRRLSEMAFLDY